MSKVSISDSPTHTRRCYIAMWHSHTLCSYSQWWLYSSLLSNENESV